MIVHRRSPILIVLVGIITAVAHAQTNISGPITTNQTWDLAGSPYVLTGSASIEPGVIVFVQPDVLVVIGSNVLSVSGSLCGSGATFDLGDGSTYISILSGGRLQLNGGTIKRSGYVDIEGGAVADLDGVAFVDLGVGDRPYLRCLSGSTGTVMHSGSEFELVTYDGMGMQIHQNDFTYTAVFTYGDPGATINLEYNWWGTTDPALIEDHLHISGPNVDYDPFLMEPLPACPADVNGDGAVDPLDLALVLAAWGATSGPEDINHDGIVNVLDMLKVLAMWGPCT